MQVIPPSVIAVALVLLSVIGLLTVAYCVDFLKPPGRRARVDHKPKVPPLKGFARSITHPPRAAGDHT